MAFITCKQCGHLKNDQANFCPHCGCQNSISDTSQPDNIPTPPSIQASEPPIQVQPNNQIQAAPYYPNQQQYIPVPQQTIYIQAAPHHRPKERRPGSYSVGRLVIGIISVTCTALILFQSCAAGLSNTLKDNGSSSGTAGVICAICMLCAGIVNIAARNSLSKGPNIASFILYGIGALVTLGTVGTFSDLMVWGAISCAFAVVNLCSLIAMSNIFQNKTAQTFLLIITIVVSLTAFVITLVISSMINKDSSFMPKKTYELGDTITYNNLEITFNDEVIVTGDLVKVSVTVKNTGKKPKKVEIYDYKAYGSKGAEVRSSLYGVFEDDSIESAGELRPNASYDKYIYCEYDGDGTYAFIFGDNRSAKTIEFEVNKE